MSVYRCDECDVQKDNDIECVFDINDKQLCQSCVDDEVDLLNDPEFAEIINESEKELETDVDKMFLDMIGFYRKEIRNLNMKIVTYEFKCKGLEYEVKTLKEKLNERNN